MAAGYLTEMEQEPFDPEEFVERLAWKAMGGVREGGGENSFNPQIMHSAFVGAIKDLEALYERCEKKCERLEAVVKEEEKKHWQIVGYLQEKNKTASQHFKELDERINLVATKVVHLGDQLESVNTPRSRSSEAQKLMTHFAGFLEPGPVLSDIFSDKSRLFDAADVMHKLYMIAQELPADKFSLAQKQIAKKYDEIERNLIEEFVKAHKAGDKLRMKDIANVMLQYKSYSQCVDAFIEQSQTVPVSNNLFNDVVPMVEQNAQLIKEVFPNPEQVMAKFVLNIFHGKFQDYISHVLSDQTDTERYLRNLFDLYSKITKVSMDLNRFNMGNDSTYLSKLVTNVFHRYLDSYISVETRYLKKKYASILQRYYDSKNHQKKIITSGGIQELKRDFTAVISAKANIQLGNAENYGGETFLSEEVAISILQESKLAFKRCQVLSKAADCPGNSLLIFAVMTQHLIEEHVDYAVETGLQTIPLPEGKSSPDIYFFDIVRQANTIMHLMEKQFNNSLLPLVTSTPKLGECLQKKRVLSEQLELKLDNGLDKSLAAIVGWIKVILQTEQKRTDYKPENEEGAIVTSSACSKVVKFLYGQVERIRDSLDGKNSEAVLTELGIRFHRVLYEHLQQFQFSSVGAMCAICDLNEYRRCVQEFKIPSVSSLFDTLHALCNLLVVLPENLKQVCTGDQLSGLDRSIMANFIQLRADYKTAKLGNYLKLLS